MIRICCSPPLDARQPGPSFGPKTDSMGKLGSSELTSTVAVCPRSSHSWSHLDCRSVGLILIILFRIFPFSPEHRLSRGVWTKGLKAGDPDHRKQAIAGPRAVFVTANRLGSSLGIA